MDPIGEIKERLTLMGLYADHVLTHYPSRVGPIYPPSVYSAFTFSFLFALSTLSSHPLITLSGISFPIARYLLSLLSVKEVYGITLGEIEKVFSLFLQALETSLLKAVPFPTPHLFLGRWRQKNGEFAITPCEGGFESGTTFCVMYKKPAEEHLKGGSAGNKTMEIVVGKIPYLYIKERQELYLLTFQGVPEEELREYIDVRRGRALVKAWLRLVKKHFLNKLKDEGIGVYMVDPEANAYLSLIHSAPSRLPFSIYKTLFDPSKEEERLFYGRADLGEETYYSLYGLVDKEAFERALKENRGEMQEKAHAFYNKRLSSRSSFPVGIRGRGGLYPALLKIKAAPLR